MGASGMSGAAAVPHNPYGIGNHQAHQNVVSSEPGNFAELQQVNDEARQREQELQKRVKELEAIVEKLAEVRSDRGSSVRTRKSAEDRTRDWLRKHGVQGIPGGYGRR